MTAARTDGKAGFDHIYDLPDPRDYFRTLRPTGYQIPANAQPVFRRLVADSGATTVLDVCCSYGINAALLRFELTLDDLYDHYADDALTEASPAELAASDRDWFAERRRPHPPRVLGLDVAANAVDYGRKVGLLDGGWAEDLETYDPSPGLAERVGDVGLVTITGGIGYVSERTFDRLLDRLPTDPPPWVAAFCLRTYSYDAVADSLARHGLVTEQASATVPQRRFVSDAERDAALEAVRGRGLDPTGREDSGWYHCDFFLSRPASRQGDPPVDDLLAAVAAASSH